MCKKNFAAFVVVFVLSLFALIPASASETGTCGDNLVWTLSDEGVLNISGTGAMTDWSSAGATPWYTRRSEIKTIVIGDGVTSVGMSAFCDCTAVTSITIGKDVAAIGTSAFEKTVSLTELVWKAQEVADFPTGNRVFYNGGVNYAYGIEVTFADGVKRVPDNAFMPTKSGYVPKIASVTMADSVEYIGINAFYNGINIKTVKMGTGVKTIGEKAFWYCTSLEDVVWSNAIETIGTSAFEGCKLLKTAIIPDTTTSIGNAAFANCNTMSELYIGKGVTTIGISAFYETKNLMRITWSALNVADFEDANRIFYNAGVSATGIDLVFVNGVTRIPDNAFRPMTSSTYVPKIVSVTMPDTVAYIGKNSFYTNTNIKTIRMGAGLKTIGEKAFYLCTSLENVAWSNAIETIGASAFEGCKLLKTAIIPDTTTSLGDLAFAGCNSMTELYIGKGVTAIGPSTFSDTKNLMKITWNALSVADFEDANRIFYNAGVSATGIDLVFVNGVTRIPDNAFRPMTSSTYVPKIVSVTIPDTVTYIGKNAFYGNTTLKNLDLGSGVETIGDSAFEYCRQLVSVDFGTALRRIGERSFANCSSLTQLLLPNGLTTIESYAFADCTSLLAAVVPGGVKDLGAFAFSGCKQIRDIELKNGVETIGESAFRSCGALEKITIPSSVKTIGSGAFWSCYISKRVCIDDIGSWCSIVFADKNAHPFCYGGRLYIGDEPLSEFVIPEGITSVDNDFFYKCDGIESIVIPNSVTHISAGAFDGCASLKRITFGNGIRTVGENAFANCPLLERINISDISSWCAIDFGTGENNPLGNGVLLYIDGVLAENIAIPEGVTIICRFAFYGYDILKSVVLPDSLGEIGQYAFANCKGLTDVSLGKGLKTLGNGAFCNTSALKNLNWNSPSVNNLTADSGVFNGAGSASGGIALKFGEGVTSVPSYAFGGTGGNANIKSVDVPESLTSIGDYAFFYINLIYELIYKGNLLEWHLIDFGAYNDSVALGDVNCEVEIQDPVAMAYNPRTSKIIVVSREQKDDAVLIAALYNDATETPDMKYAVVDIVTGVNVFDCPALNYAGADTFKFFVWSGTDSIRPICKPCVVE